MTEPDDALQLAFRLADELERRSVPYAIGGALAYGVWGEPRGTKDVDVNVFVGPERLDDVFAAVRAAGAEIDATLATRQSEERGLMVAHWPGGFRLDLFTPSIDFAWEAGESRVLVDVRGRTAWFLSAEAIAVFKLLFFRGKDRGDLERLVAVAAELDSDLVRRKLVEMLGEEDERVGFWDEIVARHRPAL